MCACVERNFSEKNLVILVVYIESVPNITADASFYNFGARHVGSLQGMHPILCHLIIRE